MNSSSKSRLQCAINNSLAIRQEIQRFESVHPSIYAIYDLIELIPDHQISQQIREHVVCIEDSFVNSQEWTISRSVPDLRLGIIGSLSSGKSALVHRYLTGSYMQEESPEGGRFKKEIVIDNQSYLLLIRDEGGPPELQFASWVDAIIYVFSLENEASFNAVHNFYLRMSNYRNCNEIPIILVGTQDSISEKNPRVIDDSRARKLASDLKRCSYYETCATYGLNVERVFQDACQKIIQHKMFNLQCSTPTNSRPTTPQGTRLGVSSFQYPTSPSPTNGLMMSTGAASTTTLNNMSPNHQINDKMLSSYPKHYTISASSHHIPIRVDSDLDTSTSSHKWGSMSHATSQQTLLSLATENNNFAKFISPPLLPQQQSSGSDNHSNLSLAVGRDSKELQTPTSTPTTTRKSRRKSNLFIPSSKKSNDDKIKNSELGVGRSIPLKQGYLYKKSSKSLNKEWKKKYVTLCDDGRLTYHPSLHDYMDNVHGKEIPLQFVTVKVPGQKPRGSKSIITNSFLSGKYGSHASDLSESVRAISLTKETKKSAENVLLSAFDAIKDPAGKNLLQHANGDDGTSGGGGVAGDRLSNSASTTFLSTEALAGKFEAQTPNLKKRHRRMKSSGFKNNDNDDTDVFDFLIVSLDSKQWHFEAATVEERDKWVSIIEQEIFKSLQGNESSKSKLLNSNEINHLQLIRDAVAGNNLCVDCNAPNPEWASLNYGIVMCIECSGIHRNLGSHISKVRSLALDEWPPAHISVMLSIGNKIANSVWEANPGNRVKPQPTSSHEEKESWIRSKYEAKEFLPKWNKNTPIGQQLIEAVIRKDIQLIILLLAFVTPEEINAPISTKDLRTPLHICCGMGHLALAQLLIWHQANIKKTDHEGRTCLSYAKAMASIASSKGDGGSDPANGIIMDTAKSLVNLLINLGCKDPKPFVVTEALSKREIFDSTFESLSSSAL